MNIIQQKHKDKILTISEEEYLDFKIGDKYLYTGNQNRYKVIISQRQADLANRKTKAEYYLEGVGGKHLVVAIN